MLPTVNSMDGENQFVTVAMFEAGIERLARIINVSFMDFEKGIVARITDLEKKMATKDELRDLEVRLTRRIDEVETHLSACFIQSSQDIERHENLLDEHDGRLKFLEKRVI
jgi:pyruvate kinase